MNKKCTFIDSKITVYLYAVLSKNNSSDYSIATSAVEMSRHPNWVYLGSQDVVFDEPASDYVEEMIERRIKENRINELDEVKKRLAELEGQTNG